MALLSCISGRISFEFLVALNQPVLRIKQCESFRRAVEGLLWADVRCLRRWLVLHFPRTGGHCPDILWLAVAHEAERLQDIAPGNGDR